MKMIRRKKSRRERAISLLSDYLKVKAASKVAKTAAKRAPVKPLAIAGAVGAGAAGLIAAKRRGGSPATP